jgi:FAD/FMN-containing dehydrogenase
MWGHAGTGNLRVQPKLDLSKKKDVDKLFALSAEYRELVTSLGGTFTSAHNDNLLQSAHLSELYGEEFVELLAAVKHIFDPQNIFNPSKKTGATDEYARAHLREQFSAGRLHDFRVFT